MKSLLQALGAAGCAVLLAVPLSAANRPAAEVQEAAAHPRTAWAPETISGQILKVLPNQETVVLEKDGVLYDMRVTSHTRIESGNQKLSLQSLASDTHKKASVHFVPESRGDMAQSIQVMG